MQVSELQHRVAGELVELIANRLSSNRAVHSETAIVCAARLAGSLLLRSFNLNCQEIAPGTVILSEEANEQGPQLIDILASMLHHFGTHLDREKLAGESAKRGEESQLSVLQSLELFQHDALNIITRNSLGFKEAAQAAAMATAFIVKECARSIGAEVGFNIAAYGFVEGSKTVPPLLNTVS